MCLLADLGGTNVRFKLVALSDSLDDSSNRFIALESYPSRNFTCLEDAISTFLSPRHPGHPEWPQLACMCVAGPVENQQALITALSWNVNSRNIENVLRIKMCHIFNDFVGVGYGVLSLQSSDIINLNSCSPVAHGTIAVIGPGTGLGEAFLTSHPIFKGRGPAPMDISSNAASAQEYTVFPTEGGHCSFAARTPEQFALMQYVLEEKQINHVSVERVASGSGLPSIYKFLKGIPAQDSDLSEHSYINSQYINETARDESDPTSVAAVDLFMTILASEAGDMCLKTLPMGGLFVTGGVAQKFQWAFRKFKFQERMCVKGRMSAVIKQVPVFLVTHTDVGLLGCEHYALRMMKINSSPSSTPELSSSSPSFVVSRSSL